MATTSHIKAREAPQFSPADVGAIAHLYRGEMYRSKIWRTRLDTTTNWAVVTTGIAMSVTFSSTEASPLPIVLISLLVAIFMLFEARRYRFFDIWRTRVRVMETSFFGPILRGRGVCADNRWNEVLADEYTGLHFHITFWEALGRRLRRTYGWIFGVIMISYLGKIGIHPTPIESWSELWARASIGPMHGQTVLLIGAVFYAGLIVLGVVTLRNQQAVGRAHAAQEIEDRLRSLAATERF
jgi:uncharacterized membrane protein